MVDFPSGHYGPSVQKHVMVESGKEIGHAVVRFRNMVDLFVMANILRKKAVLLDSVQVRFFLSFRLYLLI